MVLWSLWEVVLLSKIVKLRYIVKNYLNENEISCSKVYNM